MQQGEVLGERFEIEHLAGTGGMGAVYRAIDRTTGQPVALKVHLAHGAEVDRFLQEARLLEELVHPAVVRYVAHGAAPLASRGEPSTGGRSLAATAYLAMEWLDGEDLRVRLDRSPITPDEAIALTRRAAAGLAAAHARGIVHRDVKPSNLFLVGGDPAAVKLLDFGVARHELRSRAITRSGAVIGTVGYMAPEQIAGERDVDARADVFTLGCVLFECLTGRSVFIGEHLVAVLAKVLMEEAPRIRELRPDLPPALDDLVMRMLSKDKRLRPADGAAVVRELDALGAVGIGPPSRRSRPPERITGSEVRFVSVILADLDRPVSQLAETLTPGDMPDMDAVRALVRPFSGNIVQLSSATVLATIGGDGSARDQAASAAACALAIHASRPEVRVAVATGRAETTGRLPVGPAIDRAAELLRSRGERPLGPLVDDVTAGLLDARFDVRLAGGRRVLYGTMADPGGRTLLGRRTPCVGREKELALLEATLSECTTEHVARAMLVTAAAGTGKSRVRHELVAKITADGHASVFVARADPMTAGSSLGLVRQIVREACGIGESDSIAQQRAALDERFASLSVPEGEPTREFIGELVGVPTDDASARLRAARLDPRVMSDWLRRSFERWLAAESDRRPVVVVIEDLHWGDLPSVVHVGSALRALADRPFFVLALARPEVHDLFPRLWADANLQEIRLGGLTRRASERLARSVLGSDVPTATVARIVERADGNAFYLEELIRTVAESAGSSGATGERDLPDTVLAMLQARLERVEPEARRILRAASVYGQVAWERGVVALLGGQPGAREVAEWIKTLLERELLAPAASDKFHSESAFAFRHALSREAAYATLTDADRERGHRLAAEWLVIAGEKDARVLADHFEKGGEPLLALPWIVKAAIDALDAGNPEAALTLVDRGIAAGASGETRGLLRALQATAVTHMGEMTRLRAVQGEALELCPPGSRPWLTTAAWVVFASIALGDPSGAVTVLGAVMRLDAAALEAMRDPGVSSAFAQVVYYLSLALFNAGHDAPAIALIERLEATARTLLEPVSSFEGYLRLTRLLLAAYTRGDLGLAVSNAREAVELFHSAGDRFGASFALNQAAWIHIDAGRFEEARRFTMEAWDIAQKIGVPFAFGWASLWATKAEVFGGRIDEALARIAALRASPNATLALSAQAFEAEAHLAQGRIDDADREARSLAERSVLVNTSSLACSVSARVAALRGRWQEALDAADRGIALFAGRLEVRIEGSALRLARYEALRALGRTDEAAKALAEAKERITRIASTLDEEGKRAYLAIDANARTLASA